MNLRLKLLETKRIAISVNKRVSAFVNRLT